MDITKMKIDQFDGIQNRLRLILKGINKVRDDLDLDKEELKSNVKKLGSDVVEIERSFKIDDFELVDSILEEVTLIKEEMRSGREEVKMELKKLSDSVAKLDKRCRRISDDADDLQARLNAALDAAKLAQERLEEEKGKSDVNMELVGRLKERERELEEQLEGMTKKMAEFNKAPEDCLEKTQVSFTECKSQETWRRGSGFIFKDFKVSQEVREVEFNFKNYIEQNKIVRRTREVSGWGWLEKMEDRMSNIVIKGLNVEEDKILEQVRQFFEIQLNMQIKVLAAKFCVDKNNEKVLLVKLESEEDVEEVMRRHKLGKDGVFIEYGEMTPQRELKKQLKIIVEKQLKHANC